jgi:CubicO group peptidase (beta-lactamase class C family)
MARHSRFSTALLALLLAMPSLAAAQSAPARREGALPPARFNDPERVTKLKSAIPEIERIFAERTANNVVPGAVMGLVVDGELVWVKGAGVREAGGDAAVTPDTVFRIASMTKSFTAMAILKLRDDGKLSLDDPAAKYVPELATLAYPTVDSPAITIRHLLTHSEGFPEDNPWGDRQLAQSDETLRRWMSEGVPFSTAPGTEFEYSNYGFAILGLIVQKASGMPYADYVRRSILEPLGMTSTTFEERDVPRDRIAPGYRWEDAAWKPEPILAHGSFGAMGGLWTSARDLSKYVAFLMSAFPARDGAETGPIRRSSAREMQQAWRPTSAAVFRRSVDAPLELSVSAYGYGLGTSTDCRFGTFVAHSGGLPGYGSLMLWLPEHGVGLIGMTNRTYTAPGRAIQEALAALHKTGALEPRVPQPSAVLLEAQRDVTSLVTRWDDALAARIAADNLFLDESAERRSATIRELGTKHGACRAPGPIEAENALRGRWKIPCERGWLEVSITLAPTTPAKVQYLSVQGVMPPDSTMRTAVDTVVRLVGTWDQRAAEGLAAPGLDLERLRRLTTAAAAWGACTVGDPIQGDGVSSTVVKLSCEKGTLFLRLSIDPATRKLTDVSLVPSRENRCVP